MEAKQRVLDRPRKLLQHTFGCEPHVRARGPGQHLGGAALGERFKLICSLRRGKPGCMGDIGGRCRELGGIESGLDRLCAIARAKRVEQRAVRLGYRGGSLRVGAQHYAAADHVHGGV